MNNEPTYRYYRRAFLSRSRHSADFVIAAVQGTTEEEPFSHRALTISDGYHQADLSFPIHDERLRRTSLRKARLLARIVNDFVDALELEAAAQRRR
jgi:hypothetical protein